MLNSSNSTMFSLEAAYQDVYDWFDDEFTLYIAGTNLVTVGVLLFWSALFQIVDIFQWPAWVLQYKIQPGKNQPLDPRLLVKVLKQVAINFTVGLSFSVLMYPLMEARGASIHPRDLPSLPGLLWVIVQCAVVEEFGFYYAHRLFHWGPLYRHYHKQHHEWQAPIAIVAVYAHPLEHVLANIMPFWLGPYLTGCHLVSTVVWYTVGLTVTSFHHSGYHLPFAPSPEFHDYHHLKFHVNYGVSGWLDRLHGTDAGYRETVQCKRHTTLLSLTPMTQLFPEQQDKKGQ